MIKKIIFIVISFFVMFINVYAEETTEINKCSYKDRAELNKLAASVEASYEIKTDETGNTYFKISIYNITEKLYINIFNSLDAKKIDIIVPSLTENGVYSFNVYDLDSIITYNIIVRSNIEGCTQDIRKFTFIKPKKNKFHDYEECKYDETEGYTYCQEWIESDFALSDSKILAKIEEQRNNPKVMTTTACINCIEDARYNAKIKKFEQIKKYIVIGLSLGISLDMIFIYLRISNIRRYEL